MLIGGWVGKVSKAKKKIKWVGGGEKIKLQKTLRSGLRKGNEKKVNMGWHMDRKENPISAPSIHIGALVGDGSLWPKFGCHGQL